MSSGSIEMDESDAGDNPPLRALGASAVIRPRWTEPKAYPHASRTLDGWSAICVGAHHSSCWKRQELVKLREDVW